MRPTPEYVNALKDRLGSIDAIGEAQTTWERIANARKRERAAMDEQLAYQRAQLEARNTGQGYYNGIAGNITQGKSSSGFEKFVNSISGQESGGNYGAINRHSGAMGKYQIMPSNIRGAGGWDKEALGYNISTQAFMNSPEIQEKIARYKLQQYYNKYGPAGAAIAWYAGPGAANKYVNTGSVSSFAQGIYPSIQAYMNSVVGRL